MYTENEKDLFFFFFFFSYSERTGHLRCSTFWYMRVAGSQFSCINSPEVPLLLQSKMMVFIQSSTWSPGESQERMGVLLTRNQKNFVRSSSSIFLLQRYQIANSWTRTAVLVQFEEVTCIRFCGKQSFLLARKLPSSETTFKLYSVLVANASRLCERKSDI